MFRLFQSRLRFSLTTMLVVVTLLGVWLGVQMKWIKDRHQAIARIRAECTLDLEFSDPSHLPQSSPAPWSVRMLGERGVYGIVVPGGCWGNNPTVLKNKENELRKLFPEVKHVWLSAE